MVGYVQEIAHKDMRHNSVLEPVMFTLHIRTIKVANYSI